MTPIRFVSAWFLFVSARYLSRMVSSLSTLMMRPQMDTKITANPALILDCIILMTHIKVVDKARGRSLRAMPAHLWLTRSATAVYFPRPPSHLHAQYRGSVA